MKLKIAMQIAMLSAVTIPSLAAADSGLAPFIDPALARQAKFPLAKARQAALKLRPGKVTDERIEKEAGGSGLRWSFNIVVARQGYEVGIDAKTGKLLENVKSGLSPD